MNMLQRHVETYDKKQGVSLINDFLQIGQILEVLKEMEDKRAFNAMYALVERHLDDQIILQERGKRIGKLQKGQTQPKGTGHKNLQGLKKEIEKIESSNSDSHAMADDQTG